MNNSLKSKEERLRRKAYSRGLRLTKGKRWDNWNGYCYERVVGYMILDLDTNCVLKGGNSYDGYELSFEEAENYINSYQ